MVCHRRVTSLYNCCSRLPAASLYKRAGLYKNCVPAECSRLRLRGYSLYLRPNTLVEAVHALAASGGQILAGGTDFFPSLADRPVGGAGVRRMPLGDFIVGNRQTQRRAGEILSQIIVPRAVENAASTFMKLGVRRYLVISIVMVAVVIDKDSANCIREARVSVGSCSVVRRRT